MSENDHTGLTENKKPKDGYTKIKIQNRYS